MQRSDQILCHLLSGGTVHSLIILGNRAASVANEISGNTAVSMTALDWQQLALQPNTATVPAATGHAGFPLRNIARFDMVYLTDLPGNAAIPSICAEQFQYLAQLKSYCQGELLFEFTQRQGLATDNHFSALGFSRILPTGGGAGDFAVYRYSLHSYKSTPAWLNSRHWANPERWNLD